MRTLAAAYLSLIVLGGDGNSNMGEQMKRKSMIAPADFKGVKCKWLGCTGGMGLAGNGCCSNRGQWWLKNCPEYESEDIYCAIEDWACEWEFFAGIRPYAWRIGHDDKNPLWLW